MYHRAEMGAIIGNKVRPPVRRQVGAATPSERHRGRIGGNHPHRDDHQGDDHRDNTGSRKERVAFTTERFATPTPLKESVGKKHSAAKRHLPNRIARVRVGCPRKTKNYPNEAADAQHREHDVRDVPMIIQRTIVHEETPSLLLNRDAHKIHHI